MALTATLSVSPSTVFIEQNVVGTLTISNSGTGAINLTSVVPNAIFTGDNPPSYCSASFSSVGLSAGQVIAVPASGSLNVPFSVIFHAPSTGPIGAGTGTFTVGAVISAQDGSVFSPTGQTVTVNPLPLPATEQ